MDFLLWPSIMDAVFLTRFVFLLIRFITSGKITHSAVFRRRCLETKCCLLPTRVCFLFVWNEVTDQRKNTIYVTL